MKDFLITCGFAALVFGLGVGAANLTDAPASAQAPGIHAPQHEQLWELHRETATDIYVLDHDLPEDDCESLAMVQVAQAKADHTAGEILCVPQRAPTEIKHSPIPRLVGYGCQGAKYGVVWADEEDQFPKCESIVAVAQ